DVDVSSCKLLQKFKVTTHFDYHLFIPTSATNKQLFNYSIIQLFNKNNIM
ncbi:MAG: hypothetical protein ACI952_002076, partial [Flavobacteriales bacterium]